MRGVRKLAALSAGFAAAVFAAHYIIPGQYLLTAAGFCALLAAAGVALGKNNGKRIFLVFLAAMLGFAGYKYHYDTKLSSWEQYYGEDVAVTARISSYPEKYDYYSVVNVKLTDERFNGISARVYDYDGNFSELRPGNEISCKLHFRAADIQYGKHTDLNISKGLFLVAYTKGDCAVTGEWEHSFLYFPQNIGHALQNQIRGLFPDDTEHFMLALLTGCKTDYYSDEGLSSAMGISGLAHVVAVSGMHVAFLIGFLQLIMGKNRRSAAVCIALVWAFVVMVGAPPSAVRAGVMQSLLLMAPIFKRENDAATSLSFALALILIANPFAAGSTGLQLSFASMAGILLYSRRIFNWFYDRIRYRGVAVNYIIASVASSLAASVFTVPLIALHFGYVSLLAPLANVLCLWAISLLFCGGYIICAIGAAAPVVGAALAGVLSFLVRYIAIVVKFIAGLKLAAVYTENRLILLWLILTYALFIALRLFRGDKFKPLVPAAASLVCLCAVMLISCGTMLKDEGTFTVLNVGNGQCLTVTEGKNAVVIDCGSSGTMDNCGDMLSSYIASHGRNKIDYLVITHLHSDHARGVVQFMYRVGVDTLIMPANAENCDEDGLYDDIVKAAEECGTEIVYIDRDTELSAGNIRLSIYEPSQRGEKNERGIMLTATVGDYDMLVTGDVNKTVERELAERVDLSATDLLIVGHHGSKHSTSEELLRAAEPETAVISVGYNTYGHPTEEVLERLSSAGITVYRTDLSGRIVVDPG